MNTQWKRFSDELPPEGACIETAPKTGFGRVIPAWVPSDRASWDYWWRIWEPPPKELTAREEAWCKIASEPGRPVFDKEHFNAGWGAACDHIEKKISSLKCSDEICHYCRTNCANIAKEAKE